MIFQNPETGRLFRFSNRLAASCKEEDVTKARYKLGLKRVYKQVDTCAAEFDAHTSYFYSTFDEENESIPTDREKSLFLVQAPIE